MTSTHARFFPLGLLTGCLALLATAVRADQNLAGNVTVTGGGASGNLFVTGAIDSDANILSFGTQGGGVGASFLYQDAAADTFTFSVNRNPASWRWLHNASINAMRLTTLHELLLYASDGSTVGVTLLPASNAIKLGSTATLTGNGSGVLTTSGALSVGGTLTATGTFTAPNAAFASGINGTPIGNTTPSTGTFSSLTVNGQITARTGSIAAIFGADEAATTVTNATNKSVRFGMPHYTNAEEPVGLVVGYSQSGGNNLSLGGGSALFNAANAIDFYTAANSTTTTGTRRGGFNAAGVFDLTGGLNAAVQRGTLTSGSVASPYQLSSTFTGNADDSTITSGYYFRQTATGTNGVAQLQGGMSMSENNTTATVAIQLGQFNYTRVSSTGNTTSMVGFGSYADFTGSGNVTGSYVGFRTLSPLYTAGTGRITGTATGFLVNNIGNAVTSTVTGFDVLDQTKGSSANVYGFGDR